MSTSRSPTRIAAVLGPMRKDIVESNTVEQRLDIALRDLDHAIGLDADGNGEITWGELRARHAEIAAYALMVDAKDEAAAAFYRHHGFIALPDSPLSLLLPLATVKLARNTA